MATASKRYNESTKRRNLKNANVFWWHKYRSRYWRNKAKNDKKKKLKAKRNRRKSIIESIIIILIIPSIFFLIYILTLIF